MVTDGSMLGVAMCDQQVTYYFWAVNPRTTVHTAQSTADYVCMLLYSLCGLL